jgi:uncharacterized RDD family membrane protein YckC
MTESATLSAQPLKVATPLRPSLLRHAAALVYDSLLVLPLMMVSVGCLVALNALLTTSPVPEPQPPQALVRVMVVFTVAAFYCAFWRKGGQTLGMQAWRIHLVADDGQRPSLKACLIRLGGACISTALLGAGYWSAWMDPQRRYWHDRWSGTHLEYRPKSRTASTRSLQQEQTHQ